MERVCSTYELLNMCKTFWLGSLSGRDQWEDLDVDGNS
jgi:hypothetical protein